jgi:hypothetical protein
MWETSNIIWTYIMPPGVPTLKFVQVGSGQKEKLPVFLHDDTNCPSV